MVDVIQADRDRRNAIYKELTGFAVIEPVASQNDWMDKYLAAHRIAAEKAATEAEHKEAADIRKMLTHALADERDWTISLLGLLERARGYVNDALEAHEHSDGRALLTEIDEALRPDASYCFTKTRQAAKR